MCFGSTSIADIVADAERAETGVRGIPAQESDR